MIIKMTGNGTKQWIHVFPFEHCKGNINSSNYVKLFPHWYTMPLWTFRHTLIKIEDYNEQL